MVTVLLSLGDRFDEVIDFMNVHKSKRFTSGDFNTFEYQIQKVF
jgi:hypothetical protein